MKLSFAIKRYVEMKRLFGVSFKMGERVLQALSRRTGDVSVRSVKRWHVSAFLDRQTTSNVMWLMKYRMLKAFFDFWMARNEVSDLPLPRSRAASRRTFSPYIYSLPELRKLLRCTSLRRAAAHREIDSLTLRTILLFLYGTGARGYEALALARGDVSLKDGTVTLRRPNTDKVRTVPLGPSVLCALREYSKVTHQDEYGARKFFTRRDGFPISAQALLRAFGSLRRKAGIQRRDGICRQPRIWDLRHTFAVHCLNAWLKEGKDLHSMLPLLAAYLGHISLSSTEAYLSEAPDRFWKQLSRLSHPPFAKASSRKSFC
jgi:integrase/recombinase XerD